MSVDKSPVYNVKAIPIEKIQANDYNPNVVAPPEMKLLELSIWEDGLPCLVSVTMMRKRITTSWWTVTIVIRY